MRTAYLTTAGLLLILVASPGYAQRNALADGICYKFRSHAEQRGCLEAQAEASENQLLAAEAQFRRFLGGWDTEAQWRSRALDAFEGSVATYRSYRDRQCELVASLAAGGNATSDLRLLCQIELNKARATYLAADSRGAI